MTDFSSSALLNDDKFQEKEEGRKEPDSNVSASALKAAALVIFCSQVFFAILLSTCSNSNSVLLPATGNDADNHFNDYYSMYSGVLLMMFIGFGYLMSFLSDYGYGSVAFTFLVTVIGFQLSLFTEAFFSQLWSNDWGYVSLDIISLINSLYAVAAVLITFGGIIGKASPLQLIVLTLLEITLYSFNNQILMHGALTLQDVGGTISIHMFGAYFGLAVAWSLGLPFKEPNVAPNGGYIPDLFSFVGTLFLWVYWPSFVGGVLAPGGAHQQQAVVNTVLSMVASTTCTFAASAFFSSAVKFRPVDIQNATLAGGVAIGAIAGFPLPPVVPCAVGMLAGLVSTFGFLHIQPCLESVLSLNDSCGINNLHGMPSVIGGLASVVVVALANSSDKIKVLDAGVEQVISANAGNQMLGVVVTLGFAITTGLLSGAFLRCLHPSLDYEKFHDIAWWQVSSSAVMSSSAADMPFFLSPAIPPRARTGSFSGGYGAAFTGFGTSPQQPTANMGATPPKMNLNNISSSIPRENYLWNNGVGQRNDGKESLLNQVLNSNMAKK